MSDVKMLRKTTTADRGTSSPHKKAPSKRSTQTHKLDLVLVGEFSSDYDETVTRAAVQASADWYADTRDFMDVATRGRHGALGRLTTIGDLMSLFESRKEGSIRRVDFLTHGEREMLVFRGHVFAPRGEKRADLNVGSAMADILTTPFMSLDLLGSLLSERDEAGRFARIRRSFAKGAEIHLYACRTGSGGLLAGMMAKAFGARVFAFTLDVRYRRSKHDLLMRVGDSPEVADYRKLDMVAAKYVVVREP